MKNLEADAAVQRLLGDGWVKTQGARYLHADSWTTLYWIRPSKVWGASCLFLAPKWKVLSSRFRDPVDALKSLVCELEAVAEWAGEAEIVTVRDGSGYAASATKEEGERIWLWAKEKALATELTRESIEEFAKEARDAAALLRESPRRSRP